MEEYIQICTTFQEKKDAQNLSRILIKKRFAACAQIIGPITSTYRWEGKIEEQKEWLCLIKTTKKLYKQIEQFIQDIHPYRVPEIITLPVLTGSNDYLSWIKKETRG